MAQPLANVRCTQFLIVTERSLQLVQRAATQRRQAHRPALVMRCSLPVLTLRAQYARLGRLPQQLEQARRQFARRAVREPTRPQTALRPALVRRCRFLQHLIVLLSACPTGQYFAGTGATACTCHPMLPLVVSAFRSVRRQLLV